MQRTDPEFLMAGKFNVTCDKKETRTEEFWCCLIARHCLPVKWAIDDGETGRPIDAGPAATGFQGPSQV